VALLLPGLLAVRPIGAAEGRAAEAPEVAELERLSVEWMQAMERKDEAALRALMAPEYVLSSPGVQEEVLLEEWIGNAIGMTWSQPRFESLRVRVSGDHAVVSSRFYFHVSPIPWGLDSGLIDTWERRDGRWLVTGRYLGQSDTQDRIHAIVGFCCALLLWAAWAAWGRLSRRRKRRAATLA
jgi:hypothetical protein